MFLWQDVRFGLRMLVKDRWFTLAAATALALGIGVNAMVFTLVNAVLVRNLPFRDPTRIMAVNMRDGRDRQLPVSLPDFEDWRRTSRTFSGLTAIYGSPFNVADEGQAPEQFVGTYISTNVFQLIGNQPILGRNFLPEDDRLGATPVLLLAHGLWKRLSHRATGKSQQPGRDGHRGDAARHAVPVQQRPLGAPLAAPARHSGAEARCSELYGDGPPRRWRDGRAGPYGAAVNRRAVDERLPNHE
jgi:hypothetical protein